MVTSLAELNDLVNNVTNYITEKACRETEDGTFRFSIDDLDAREMNGYVSEQDLCEYADFICAELNGRKELRDVDYHDHEFSGTCQREYCPNLEDRREEESLLPVTHTLSMTELAQLGQTGMETLRETNFSALRYTLGMDFPQMYRAGLTDRDYFFHVHTAEGFSDWDSNMRIAMIQMRHQCKEGNKARLDYCHVNKKGEVTSIPIAKEQEGKMVSIPAGSSPRPQSYWNAMGYLEGDIYKLPTDFKLTYLVFPASNGTPASYATLSEAISAFQNMCKGGAEPALSAQIINHLGNVSETIRLTRENGRVSLLAETYPYYTLNLHREEFYPELFQHAFPGREMGVNKWSVRVIAPGEAYDRSDQPLHDETTPLVEFRDMSVISPAYPDGIVASRVTLDSLIGKEGKGGMYDGQALLLNAKNSKWRLSAYEMHPVLIWLRLKENEISKEQSYGLTDKIRDAEHRCADRPAQNSSHAQQHFSHQGGVTR